ncbi:ribosome assembly cofactor RimP [Polaribacter tangerinus]|uniref:ribosome assembly cofactor RimP n=1 Tax=Polaribacter tangerinus TaxID=1920034 RepID=UPI000B4BA7FE|nr:ribosome assembly cofactor RimP [Polaribacter tangerinus]
MNHTTVKSLVEEALAENESLFLIDFSVSTNEKIQVVVDGDQGVPLNECIRISKHVNGNIDRETYDFSLEVTTPDISHPLKVKRQYRKNLNRILKVTTAEDEFEGTLTSADDHEIILQWKAREPKPIGKGKVTVEKTATIAYNNIKEAKVKIVF